jgi:signal transduction histidine kinase
LKVQADKQRIAQVFANLLTNAIKYSSPASEIVMQVRRDDRFALVDVIDQGSGIPAEALPHLFDRFFRVRETQRSATGLGLGLFISRRIIEAHGGQLTVVSAPGRGSTFTVSLPL